MRAAVKRMMTSSEAMTRSHVVFCEELDVELAARRRCEGVMRDFFERFCTGYSRLLRVYITNYPNQLIVLLANVQLRKVYVGSYLIRVAEEDYSLVFGRANSDEEQSDQQSSQRNGGGIIKFVVLISNAPYYRLFSFLFHLITPYLVVIFFFLLSFQEKRLFFLKTVFVKMIVVFAFYNSRLFVLALKKLGNSM